MFCVDGDLLNMFKQAIWTATTSFIVDGVSTRVLHGPGLGPRAGPGRASMILCGPGRVIFFPINAPGMGRFQLLNLGVLGYGLELRFWVVIAIIVSLTITITLITTLTII